MKYYEANSDELEGGAMARGESGHLKIIKDIDPNAFVSQTSAIGVYGKGFDIMKTK